MSENKRLKGYKIDFATNTLIMNYKFHAAAQEYGTEEYKMVKLIQADFPDIAIAVKAGREQKKPQARKRMTYANMEKYMKQYDNAEALLERFEVIKKTSATVANPYKYVADWFIAQFPNYKKAPNFEGGKLYVILKDAPNPMEYKQKETA